MDYDAISSALTSFSLESLTQVYPIESECFTGYFGGDTNNKSVMGDFASGYQYK